MLSSSLLPKVLPWKRDPNPDSCLAPMKQREFPSWLKNENYMVHGSPIDVDSSSNGEALPMLPFDPAKPLLLVRRMNLEAIV